MSIFNYFNWIDVIIALVLLVSALSGMFRGFVKEASTFGVWFFSFLGAWLFSGALGSKIGEWMGEARYESWRLKFDNDSYFDFFLRLAGGIIIFIILLIFLQIVVSVFTARIRFATLSSVDKILGLLIGLIRGFILLSLIWYFANSVMAITQKSEQNKDKSYIQTIDNSIFLPTVKLSTIFIKPFLDPLVTRFSKSPDIELNMDPSMAEDIDLKDMNLLENPNKNDSLLNEDVTTNIGNDNIIDTTAEPDIDDAEDATERAITPIIGEGQAVDELPQEANDAIDNILEQ